MKKKINTTDLYFTRFKNILNDHFFALLICFLFIFAGILVSLNRYWQYEVFYYDFGIFDQAIWKVSRFEPPIIDHLVVGGRWIFADHFNPTIFLISPFYWLTQRSEMTLILQATLVGLSGLVLYRIGLEILNNRLLAISVMISYLLFLGIQNAVISDFHEVTISTLPLLLMFLMIIKRKAFWYFIFLLITLGIKESVFLLVIGIGLFILVSYRRWAWIGLLTILIALLWGFLSIKVIIPYFSGDVYHYAYPLPARLEDIVSRFFDSPIKQRTLFYSFLSFGFLPILSPQFWFLIVQDFFIRFIPNYVTRWDLGLHYSAQLASVLGVSSIYGFCFLQKIKKLSSLLPYYGLILIINAVVLYRFILHGPLALAYNKAFYEHTKDFQFLDDLTGRIPKDASVMTQNNLAVRFTHQTIWLLRDEYWDYKADYIVVDARNGQNPNNFFGVLHFQKTIENLKKDENYFLSYQTKEQFVFKRKAKY